MPKFGVIAQSDENDLDFEEGHADTNTKSSTSMPSIESVGRESCFKYGYLSPFAKKAIAGVSAFLLILVIVTIALPSAPTYTWPPPRVSSTNDILNSLDKNRPATAIYAHLEVGDQYRQISHVTTGTSLVYEGETLSSTIVMLTENEFEVADDPDGDGFDLDVVLTHITVSVQDTNGDANYYDSEALHGTTNFDSVLETMIYDHVMVDVNKDFEITNEIDQDNALEQMEQEYEFGTTTGLSAIMQIYQFTQLTQFLPSKGVKVKPNDKWDTTYVTEDATYVGSSTLLGYTTYQGHDCAVITTKELIDQNLLDMNQESEQNAQDNGVEDYYYYYDMSNFDSLEVKSGSMNSIVLWDMKYQFPRYSKMTITLTDVIHANDDISGDTSIPMTETLEMYMGKMENGY